MIGQRDPIAEHIHTAALGSGGLYLSRALHIGITAGLQYHPATFQSGRACLDQSAVPERAGKDGNGIALERAQIDGLISGCLNLQADAFQPPTG